MRIIHISDIHFDERRQLAGEVRVDAEGRNHALVSTARCVEAIREQALAAGQVDLWCVTGDVFDSPVPTPLEERAAIEAIEAMAGSAPVVVLSGNHDVPAAGAGATALECLKVRRNIHVVEAPRVLTLQAGGVTVSVVCVPYPRRAELVALAPDGSREERNALASQILRGILQGLRVQAANNSPGSVLVALYHGSLDGATVGAQPRTISNDVALSPADFGGFAYAGCGHIHRMQRLAPNVYYAGSPDRVDFDEEADYKGGLDVTISAAGVLEAVRPIASEPRVYVTARPEHLAAANDTWTAGGTVYRVKGEVMQSEAVEIRRRVAELAAAGVWISASALRVVSEIRTRDELASADETVAAFLERWLTANPAHVEEAATVTGTEPADIAAAVLDLNTEIAGGA